MTTTIGNPLGAMALAVVVLLSGIHLARRLFRQVQRGGGRTAKRISAVPQGRRIAPGAGMGTNQAGGHLAPLTMLAAATTLNASPLSEWVLGRTARPLSPNARRLMRSSLHSAESQRRWAYDRASYQWAINRRLNLRDLDITDPHGVANAADTLTEMGAPPSQIGSALIAAGADQRHVNLVLRARADLYADTTMQQSFNLPVQRYLSAMRHVDGKQRVSNEEFLGYLGVASAVASNLFARSERALYEIPGASLAPGASVRDRFQPYLDPASPRYSPYVATMVNDSRNRVAFRAAIAAAPPDFIYTATADERNAVVAFWSREAHTTARAWAQAPTSVAARDAVSRTRESVRNIDFELGKKFASPFSP